MSLGKDMNKREFEIEVFRFRHRLLREAIKWLNDTADAEDIVQDVMLKLWSIRERLKGYQSIEALALTMTKRLCLNRLRDTKRLAGSDELPDRQEYDSSPEHLFIEREEELLVERLIATLPDKQQATLRMKHIDGLEVEEIAKLTGCSEVTVRSNLMRARRKIMSYFIK